MTSHHQRAAEIVPEWDTFRDSLPEGDACDCGKWRLCKHDDDQRIYKVRAAVAAALAEVEREAMERTCRAVCFYCHKDYEIYTDGERYWHATSFEAVCKAGKIRAAFAADEREAPK